MLTDRDAINSAAHGDGNGAYEFPCSLAQQRFWILDQLAPGDSAYNIAVRWKLVGNLNVAWVEEAFNSMIGRHEVLRTTFRSVDGEPSQVVWPRVSISVPVVDLSRVPASEREQEAEEVTVAEARKKFDLTCSPLIRATLLRFADDEHTILVTVHHIVADGWSIGIMAKEFCDFYEAKSRNAEPVLPELSIQYADFAVWQRRLLSDNSLQAQTNYWQRKLAGLQPLEIETDYPRSTGRPSNGTIISVLLPRTLTDPLKDFSVRHGVTLYTAALATFKMLLWHATGRSDVAVGTQVAGRNQTELESLIGAFINTLVMRTEVTGDLKYTDLLARVHETVTEAIANQEMPFERLVELNRSKRGVGRNPLFSINFIYQRAFIQNRDFAGISLVDLPSRSPGAIYDLNFFMVERVDGWRWSCEFNPELYSPRTIERMLGNFELLLRAVMQYPSRRVAEFSVPVSPRQELPATENNQARLNVEAELTRIWQELLSVSPISRTADFFELGGHSLLAARMVARVEKAFGKKVPLAVIFERPTIQQLAGLLLGDLPSSCKSELVALQAKGSRTPIFCLHGAFNLRNLAIQLGSDQPFYSVNLPVECDLKPPYSVPQLAALHVEAIREFQPSGPYYLTGWCREGLLAYEVAQQLHQQGQKVELLAMFDTWIPEYLARFPRPEARRARRLFEIERLRLNLQSLRNRSFGENIKYVRERWLAAIGDRVRHMRWRLSNELETTLHSKLLRKRRSQDEMLLLAVSNYRPEGYAGRAILFRSDKYRTWEYWDHALGWGHLMPNLQVHEVPGIHDSMLSGPHLLSIAEVFTAAMDGVVQLTKKVSPAPAAMAHLKDCPN
jgi:thioesterase domain-containing protein/acyl carrier protein